MGALSPSASLKWSANHELLGARGWFTTSLGQGARPPVTCGMPLVHLVSGALGWATAGAWGGLLPVPEDRLSGSPKDWLPGSPKDWLLWCQTNKLQTGDPHGDRGILLHPLDYEPSQHYLQTPRPTDTTCEASP